MSQRSQCRNHEAFPVSPEEMPQALENDSSGTHNNGQTNPALSLFQTRPFVVCNTSHAGELTTWAMAVASARPYRSYHLEGDEHDTTLRFGRSQFLGGCSFSRLVTGDAQQGRNLLRHSSKCDDHPEQIVQCQVLTIRVSWPKRDEVRAHFERSGTRGCHMDQLYTPPR